MIEDVASVVLAYAAVDAPTLAHAFDCIAVLPYAHYLSTADPVRAAFSRWAGPVSPRHLAAAGHYELVDRFHPWVIQYELIDLVADAASAGDIARLEWLKTTHGAGVTVLANDELTSKLCIAAATASQVLVLEWWLSGLDLTSNLPTPGLEVVIELIHTHTSDMAVLKWLLAVTQVPVYALPSLRITPDLCTRAAAAGSIQLLEWIVQTDADNVRNGDQPIWMNWMSAMTAASKADQVEALNWMWGQCKRFDALVVNFPRHVLVHASTNGNIRILDWWYARLLEHPVLFEFDLLSQRELQTATARSGHIASLEWWLEHAHGNVQVSKRSRPGRKASSDGDSQPGSIIFPLKAAWFGDWCTHATVPMLEWWYSKCLFYGEAWNVPLQQLALAGSSEVLDWAWERGARMPAIDIRALVIVACESGHTEVLEWMWQQPGLFTPLDLARLADSATLAATQRGHLDTLEWYLAKLKAECPGHRWKDIRRLGRKVGECQHLSLLQRWAREGREFNDWSPYLVATLTEVGDGAGLDELLSCGRISKLQLQSSLRHLLEAPKLASFWFWARICATASTWLAGQPSSPNYTTAKVSQLAAAWSICRAHGWDFTNDFRSLVMLIRTCPVVRWWQLEADRLGLPFLSRAQVGLIEMYQPWLGKWLGANVSF
ncbi:hypothetical protein BC828DRAFT_376471 [Blastocladiella britannica]|nr:hypothetical protein BC828DRAFT_376471 [Blastocladiella britannica]